MTPYHRRKLATSGVEYSRAESDLLHRFGAAAYRLCFESRDEGQRIRVHIRDGQESFVRQHAGDAAVDRWLAARAEVDRLEERTEGVTA